MAVNRNILALLEFLIFDGVAIVWAFFEIRSGRPGKEKQSDRPKDVETRFPEND